MEPPSWTLNLNYLDAWNTGIDNNHGNNLKSTDSRSCMMWVDLDTRHRNIFKPRRTEIFTKSNETKLKYTISASNQYKTLFIYVLLSKHSSQHNLNIEVDFSQLSHFDIFKESLFSCLYKFRLELMNLWHNIIPWSVLSTVQLNVLFI